MRTRRPARPAPPPQTPIAERLEDVRARAGFPSLRGFWSRLCEGWGEPVSYEAVRTYHYDRDPPASYLVRVTEAFPDLCTLDWLLGSGPRTKREAATEDESSRGLVAELRSELELLSDLPYVVAAAVLHHMNEWDRARWQDPRGDLSEHFMERARAVWADVLRPFEGRRPKDWPLLTEYVLAALHARTLALHVPTFDPASRDPIETGQEPRTASRSKPRTKSKSKKSTKRRS